MVWIVVGFAVLVGWNIILTLRNSVLNKDLGAMNQRVEEHIYNARQAREAAYTANTQFQQRAREDITLLNQQHKNQATQITELGLTLGYTWQFPLAKGGWVPISKEKK